MANLFNLLIFIIGFNGIVAETIILRELLVSFYGNELTLGIILSNWVIAGSIGAFCVGKIIDKKENKIGIFVILQGLFILSLFLAIYLSRSFKGIMGFSFGEGIGLKEVLFSSFLIVLPLNFCLGGLFSTGCSMLKSAGKVYAWEAIGSLIAGVTLTYIFVPRFNSYQISYLIFIFNLFVYLIFYRFLKRSFRRIGLFLIVIFILFIGVRLDYLNQFSIHRQWPKKEVLEYRNSIYANIVVTKDKEQYTFFYNGIPIVVAPYPDIAFIEEFGNFPLLFHDSPKKILIIGSGYGGLINEFLKHPLESIDYLELDPLLIKMFKKYPTELIKKELIDPRVKVVNADARPYLKNQAKAYDVILIGISKPSELSINRLFTREFFALAKKRLRDGGILAFWLPGSLTYMSKELKDLDACILNGLEGSYKYIRVIPGDFHIVLATDSQDITIINAGEILRRIGQRKIKTRLLLPAYLNYRFDKNYHKWFEESISGATKKINQDFLPLAVFEMVVFWNKQFSPKIAQVLESMQNLSLWHITIFIFLLTCLLFYFKTLRKKTSIVYSIFTTGFFVMFLNLILIFSFQIIYGYLYYKIGLLIGIFMAGIALGSFLMAGILKIPRDNFKLLVILEAGVVVFSFSLAFIILGLAKLANFSDLIFLGLFMIPGLLLGLEFPLAVQLYLGKNAGVGKAAGFLYATDLAGGWLAGLCTGIAFLPILGLFGSCMAIVIFKLSSLILLLTSRKNL